MEFERSSDTQSRGIAVRTTMEWGRGEMSDLRVYVTCYPFRTTTQVLSFEFATESPRLENSFWDRFGFARMARGVMNGFHQKSLEKIRVRQDDYFGHSLPQFSRAHVQILALHE